METLVAQSAKFKWPAADLYECDLKLRLLDTVWSNYSLNGNAILMRPGLIPDFDNARNRLLYNGDYNCYHIFGKPAKYVFEPGSRKPAFIFKTGSNEVSIIEVKVCWKGYLDDFPDWYSYCISNGNSRTLKRNEEVIIFSIYFN